jgi:beta-lactamase regulating signal transducer with metallopeptidase domain
MEWLTYLLKVSACSALFFAFYLLVLRKLTFFKINRFYLLFSVLISFIIPALQFTIEREVVAVASPTIIESQNAYETTLQAQVTVDSIQTSGTGYFNWLTLLPYLYGGIVGCILLLAAWRLFQLLKHTKAPIKEFNGLKLVAKKDGFTNCSFFNYVFIDENSLTEAELAVLLSHEEVHAKQYHSVDKLILMIAKAFLWFNPIVYLYDKALEQAHEFEADEATSQNIGTESYATLLLKLAVSKSSSPLLHNFVKNPIKQRIKMLFNSKSKNMKKLMYLLVLPIGLGLLWSFTVDVVSVSRTTENKPFVNRLITNNEGRYRVERVSLNTVSGKQPLTEVTFYKETAPSKMKVWVFINQKWYSEEETSKFDASFISKLSTNRGWCFGSLYAGSESPVDKEDLVFWIGNEPELSASEAKRRVIYKKYNGTSINGQIVDLTYSSTNALEGFIVKLPSGEKVKANVEIKFTKQIEAMIAKGDQVSIKIYNADYWAENSEFPRLISYKLMKDGKVLFDRWPKATQTK